MSLATNRRARRDRIVSALDAGFIVTGRKLWGSEIVDALRSAPEAFWVRVQKDLGMRTIPSPETRALVLAVYETRTEGERLARNYLASVCPGLVAA